MREKYCGVVTLVTITVLFSTLACSLLSAISAPQNAVQPLAPPVPELAVPAPTTAVVHVMMPSASGSSGQLVYDVVSEDTAPERRAPYGDSYDINRLERPFEQDMTYLPYLDIVTYAVDGDSTWWYVSVRLVGLNTGSEPPLQYGVEIDLDHDGFGDFLIIARPPFSSEWDAAHVQIFADQSHDTGGISAEHSDAPLNADGYETTVFNGGAGDLDPDLAWVRTVIGDRPTVQFAFKKAWSGVQFMLGVVADAGPQEPGQMDYVDHYTLAEAGSPVRDDPNYPLKALFAVDNCCREAFGFQATGYEPQLCPRVEPTREPRAPTAPPPAEGCPDPGNCPYNGWVGWPDCYCAPY